MTAHQTIEAEAAAETMTGAEMLIRALIDQEVEVLFGYPGGAVLPLYDALFAEPRLRHILVRHEQGATHPGEGYPRATRKCGGGLGTSGPCPTTGATRIP